MKNLSFRLKTKAWPVTIENEKGEELKYELRELKAAARDKYVDNLSGRLLTDKKGDVIGIKKYEGMQADLLIKCMHDEKGEPITKATLDGWPGNVVKGCFEAAQVLNQFRKPDEKNRILSEQIHKWLGENQKDLSEDVTPEAIEEVIEDSEKRLFADAKDEETEAAG